MLNSLHEYKKLLLLTKNSTVSPDSIYWTAIYIGQYFAMFAGEANNFHLIKDFLDFDNLKFVNDNEE